jgi:alkylation response protein AidB-like acyl-CoA dehydrogenase
MDLSYGKKYDSFRASVKEFLESHRGQYPNNYGLGRPSDESILWQKKLIERGYAARTIPKQYGGFGAKPDILEMRIIVEEFIRAGAPRGLANQGVSMLVPTLLEAGSEEQKQQWVKPTIEGETVWCQGYSEPNAGSDLASLKTSAIEDGDDFIINGQKIWTSTAQQADMMFLLVRTERDAPKHQGISYVLVPMTNDGIEVRPLKTMTGAAEFNEVFFTDLRVPQKNVVGKRGEGWKIANTTLRHERFMLGDPNQAEDRLSRIIALMKKQTLHNERLIDKPVWRQRAVELQAEVMAMKYHGLRLLSNSVNGESSGLAGMIVKLQGCELNYKLAELAIDVLGVQGIRYGESDEDISESNRWQRHYMFDLGLIIGGGTTNIQKNIIAERGLAMPKEPKIKTEA